MLTGVDRAKHVLAAEMARGAVRVGSARVRIDGRHVVVVDEGDDPLDLLRAACAAVWGSGMAIHALDVPPSLYCMSPGAGEAEVAPLPAVSVGRGSVVA